MNHGWTYQDRIRAADAGQTALAFYSGRYRHSSAATWRRRIEAGEVTRRGAPLAPGDFLRAGDELAWARPPWDEGEVPEGLPIVYEDDALVAVDKPAGLPVLPDGGFLENTVWHRLAVRYPGETVAPVHRLNRGTSGLLLCARTPEARRDLTRQFRDKTDGRADALRKTYIARSVPLQGVRAGDRIEIDTPIGPVAHPLLGTVNAALPGGRPALSRCEVLETGPEGVLWRVDLVTGRPHQIRIHLASIGAPLAGEPLFLPGGAPRPDALPGDGGYFLRSVEIDFAHPATGRRVRLAVGWMVGPSGGGEVERYLASNRSPKGRSSS